MRERLVRDDPLPLVAALNTMPVLWSDIIAGRASMALSDPQRRAFEVGAAHGWAEGLLVPIHGPGGYLVLASFAGRAPVTMLAAQAELHLLSLHAHVHLVRLAVTGADSAMAPHDLSIRELEALTCLVAGLSDASAAQKMGISARTVRFHIENARRKLGVKTRSQAVSAALSRGLLGGCPPDLPVSTGAPEDDSWIGPSVGPVGGRRQCLSFDAGALFPAFPRQGSRRESRPGPVIWNRGFP